MRKNARTPRATLAQSGPYQSGGSMVRYANGMVSPRPPAKFHRRPTGFGVLRNPAPRGPWPSMRVQRKIDVKSSRYDPLSYKIQKSI
jgi:hypothetical protein